MKKFLKYFGIAVAAIIMVAALGGWWYYQSLYNDYKSESKPMHQAATGDSLATNSLASFSDMEIAIYGKWNEPKDSLNYTVFTLDDAGDGFYWGKEWDEADFVFENDLEDHGSGWFKWKAKKNSILFLYQTNLGLAIPSEYKLMKVEDEQLGFQGKFSSSANILNRVYN